MMDRSDFEKSALIGLSESPPVADFSSSPEVQCWKVEKNL